MQSGASSVKHRNIIVVMILSIVLPVIYWGYWYVATSNELKKSEAGNPSPWIGISGMMVSSAIVAIFVILENILNGGIGFLFFVLTIIALIGLLNFTIATIINYWHSIKLISSRYKDDYAIALLCGFAAVSVKFLLDFMPVLIVIPAICFVVLIILAQIELNGYAAVSRD